MKDNGGSPRTATISVRYVVGRRVFLVFIKRTE